jgi:lipoprotein NlpD
MKQGRVVLALAVILVAGCAGSPRAPVVERAPESAAPVRPAVDSAAPLAQPPAQSLQPGTYAVRRGDTLYNIALDNGLDYRELAAWNSIADPNVIREGQLLLLKPPPSDVQVRPISSPDGVQARPLAGAEPARARPAAPGDLVTEPKAVKLPYSEENLALLSRPAAPAASAAKPQPAPPAQAAPKPESQAKAEEHAKPESQAKAEEHPKPEPGEDALDWSWPASGKIIADPTSKGVDIAGKKGDPVNASASGRVVYIGEGLRGYGKLVIIKHNNTYLSAYAHNDAILVKEGQTVVKGQKIAEIGSTGTDQTKLHFEIRQLGKPVDPLKFLPGRPS